MMDKKQNSVPSLEQIEFYMQLENIFMPYARRQRESFYNASDKETRFVHYTSAEAALNIIKTKRIWMRNATCMSDYREVQHGFEILNTFFSDEKKRNLFVAALDECVPGAAEEAIALFNQWWNDIQFSTYIASISEHDAKEDQHGRLSMWRAFGGTSARVALVFKLPWMSGASLALNIMFSPVAYLKQDEVHEVVAEIIENIHKNGAFLQKVERQHIVGSVFNMFVAAVCCLKHEGFHEEREWRVIYAPSRQPSDLIESSIECIGGIPQTIYKIPVDVAVSDTLQDLDLPHMFDRLIIGPSPFSWAMYQAFVEELKKAGVKDAETRVIPSGIPIRS